MNRIHTLAVFAVLSGILWPDYGRSDADHAERLQYGVYDPEERFAASDRLAIEHVFISWQEHDEALIPCACSSAARRNRWLMVTIEPWPAHGRTVETLFSDILTGLYDSDIANVCGA